VTQIPLTGALVATWLRTAAEEIARHRDELTALDADIGDADHGINMDRGFQAALERIESDHLEAKEAGAVAHAIAMTLISTVGGAAGPLYGTGMLRFATSIGARTEIESGELAVAFRAAVEGVQQRGKARLGEKTMLDALIPACEALEAAVASGQPLAAAVAEAAEAARQGMLATIPMLATKGRASYLGERSRGHQDPGATSAWLLIRCASDCLGGG
jgi:phosphoenolpyruvate---glycerone phosphotransferase subunit DhaL